MEEFEYALCLTSFMALTVVAVGVDLFIQMC